MKKKLFSLFLIVFLLFLPIVVLAEEDAATVESSPGSLRRRLETQRAEMLQQKAKVQVKLSEKAQNRIRNNYGKIRHKLQSRIERLEKFVLRIEERFVHFEEKGRDTAMAKAKLEEAKSSMEIAKTDLISADAKLEEVLSSDDPKSLRSELHQAIKLVRDDIKTARQTLSRAVNLMVRNNPDTTEVQQ